jgi:IrrE N-terminal-like domain
VAGHRSYSVAEIHRRATNLLATRFPDGVSIPVDVDYLLETEAGVSLDTMRGLRQECGVAGCVVFHPEEGLFTVLLDEQAVDTDPTFARFTAAEELGHLVLHRSVMQSIASLNDVVELHKSPAYYNTLDRNAKRFAASILMPADRLRSHAAAEYAELFATKADRALLPAKLLFRLSQRYRVSAAPMRYRLTEYPVYVTAAIERSLKAGSPELLLT